MISYSIPTAVKSCVKVYDILGNEIATLVDEEKSAGSYEVDMGCAILTKRSVFLSAKSR